MTKQIQDKLRLIPQVDRLLLQPELIGYREKFPDLTIRFAREAVDELRERILRDKHPKDYHKFAVGYVITKVEGFLAPRFKRVINCTGIILHTGLGRAPLPQAAQANLREIIQGYSNLELNLETGNRGQRLTIVEDLLCQLTGAEASVMVNNNAAAVLLALNSIANRKEVIVSRGELVEIGGSFRIPEVMKKSGAKLVEAGATNKTKLADYADAVNPKTGAILKVHTSNYKVMGFTQEVGIAELVNLGREHGIPVVSDLGGGVLIDLRKWGLPYEPVASEYIEAGVDLVTFSGDKVLGGPQSGIIIGKKWAVDKCRKNHLMRALRCGKLTYAAMEPVLKQYLNPAELLENNPSLKMLASPPEVVKELADRFLDELIKRKPAGLKSAELRESHAQAGSGALPLEKLPSWAVFLKPEGSLNGFANKLRTGTPPVIGYIKDDELALDFKTVFPEQIAELVNAVIKTVGNR
ncbi:L-seryl-tRNA(Sec) selenium transferase [bacterium]|nr:L-seryl-tRNA(Sec) selenium transferase [FCB group bacterium]MBL7192064.1 L-seryl-tRNA(Sec) selenium transferase [bacterium]